MHKSGTTLVSQVLHHSNISMGEFDENVSYDGGNKYERESALQLDMDILGVDDYEVLELARPKSPRMTVDQRQRMRDIIERNEGNHADWGFKDPRACLLFELWEEELPDHRIIAVFRDPAQVWPRFKWRGKRKYHTNFNRAYSYLARWHEHNQGILDCLRATEKDYIVLSYNELMSGDDEFEVLNRFCGGKLVDRRKTKLFRSRSRMDIFLKFADWLLQRTRGLSIENTMRDLEALRRAGK